MNEFFVLIFFFFLDWKVYVQGFYFGQSECSPWRVRWNRLDLRGCLLVLSFFLFSSFFVYWLGD